MDIKFDKRNYRIHNEKNKSLIKKSLSECGAGRSILLDAQNEIIAGNGVYEQAKSLGIPVKVIETDGKELIAVKRTDLDTQDTKRKRLAVLDNSTSDTSEFNYELLREDLQIKDFGDLGIKVPEITVGGQGVSGQQAFTEEELDKIGEDVSNEYLTPEKMQQIKEDFPEINNRVIICYKPEQKEQLEKILGISLSKVLYNINEIMGA